MSDRMIPLHIADQAVAACEAELARVKAEADQLKAEVERLTKIIREECDDGVGIREEAQRLDIENQHLKAEVDRLEDFNFNLRNFLMQDEKGNLLCYADYARLKAEVERLTKAGDAMAKLLSCCGNPQSEVRGWNAAKEVQS